MAATTTQRAFMSHHPRQLRRYIERGGGREDPPTSARRHRPAAAEPDRQDEPVGGWMHEVVDQPNQPVHREGSDGDSARARARFRSAVHVVQATHRWQRQTQDAQSGQPWPEMPNIKPHLLVRSAKYKKLRRQLAAKERAKKARAKEERLRLRREKDEIVAAPHAPDAAICAWLADLDLEQYYPKIRTFGAVNAEELKAISPAELDGIGMRKLEKARFLKAIAEVSKHSTEKIEADRTLQWVGQVTVTCGTDIEGDVYEDGSLTHIRFTIGSSHLLLRQKACAALGMADRVGMRMEYFGPDDRWFALVDNDDMEDAVEFARHPGPPVAHESELQEPAPEPEAQSEPFSQSELPSCSTARGSQRRVEKKLAIRLVMFGELVSQQQVRGTTSMPEARGRDAAVDQDGRHLSPRGLHATAPINTAVLEATVHGWHAEEVLDAAPLGSVTGPEE